MSNPHQKPQYDIAPVIPLSYLNRRLKQCVAEGDDASFLWIMTHYRFGDAYAIEIGDHMPQDNSETDAG
jgi:hypothetical protein